MAKSGFRFEGKKTVKVSVSVAALKIAANNFNQSQNFVFQKQTAKFLSLSHILAHTHSICKNITHIYNQLADIFREAEPKE